MKKLLSLATVTFVSVASWAQSSPYKGVAPSDIVSGGDYYLYNVESGLWLQNNDRKANDWSTRGQLGVRGLDFQLNAVDGGYKINAKFGKESINRDDYYLDNNNDHVWEFVAVEKEGVSNPVNIKSEARYLTADSYTAGKGYNNQYKAGTPGQGQWYLNNPDNNNNGTWQIVTKEERLAKMLEAGETSAQDATWLVASPDFANNDRRYDKWSKTGTWVRGGDANGDWGRGSMIIESWNSGSTPHISQLVSVPNGIYAVTVQGYYRDGSTDGVGAKHNSGTEEIRAKYYANDVEKDLRSVIDGHDAAVLDPNRWRVNTDGWYVPDAMDDASRCMNIDFGYTNDALEVKVTNGQLKIGVYKTGGVDRDWVIFDNWKLTYLGPIDVSEVLDGLNSEIEKAEDFDANTTTNALAQTLAGALANAKSKLTSVDADEIADAASALASALSNAQNVNVEDLRATVAVAKAEGIKTSDAEEFLANGSDNGKKDELLRVLRNLRKLNAADKVDISLIQASEPGEGDFYIYNVGAGLFFNCTADWGTHISLDNAGMLVHFQADGEWSGAPGRPVFHLSGSGWNGMNWGEEYWDKNGENKLAFVPVEGKDKVYNLCEWDAYNWHFVYDPAEDVCDGNTHYWNAVQKRDWNPNDYKNNPYAQWMLVSPEAYKKAMLKATEASPLDVTFMIENPNFSKVNGGKWTRGWENPGAECKADRDAFCVLEWFERNVDLKQTITGLYPGKYEVSCYGFYRDGSSDGEAAKVGNSESLIQNAFLFANDEEAALPNVTSEAGNMPGVGDFRNGVDGAFANWPWQANEYFQTGLYKTTLPVEVGPDGKLTIGVKSTYNGIAGSWIVLDNFRLTCLEAYDVESVDVTSAKWATYVPQKDVEFTGSDVKAYVVTEIHDGWVKLDEVAEASASSAVLVNAERGTHFLKTIQNVSPFGNNRLMTSAEPVNVTAENTMYVLASTTPEAVFNGKNLLQGMTYNQSWYYAPGWGQIADPETTVTDGDHKLVLPSATTDQWQAQYHLQNTGIQLSKDKMYDFKITINSNKAFTGATVKLTQNDNDDLFIIADRIELKEGINELTFTGLQTNAAQDITNLKFAFDFGGNPDGTEVTISDMYLQESAQAKVGFYPVKVGTTIPVGKCFLSTAVANAPFINLFASDNETAIQGVIVNNLDGTTEVYNLAGQRLEKAVKGINIIGGKKILK